MDNFQISQKLIKSNREVIKDVQKNYQAPVIKNLGKMQKVTQNTKGASTVESESFSPEFL